MLKLVEPHQPSKMGKLPPRRLPNTEVRSREYLAPAEVEAVIAAAKGAGRYGHRDATLILLMYRHALRVGEVVSLRREQVDLEQGALHVNRLKSGAPAVHPLRGPELRSLRKLYRDYPDSPYIFSTERGGPMTTATVRKVVARAGNAGGATFPAH